MHSVLVCNDHGKILLSRYFEPQSRSESAFDFDFTGDTQQQGLMRDTAKARSSSQAEVLGETRHLWTKGTADCPQVARAKVRLCEWGEMRSAWGNRASAARHKYHFREVATFDIEFHFYDAMAQYG